MSEAMDTPVSEPKSPAPGGRRRWVLWGILSGGLILGIIGGWAWFSLGGPPVEKLAAQNPGTTALIEHRKKQGRVRPDFPSLRTTFVPLSRIPELMQKTVIVAEDAAFWSHAGVDWHEVREAFRQNLSQGRVVRGASTITQQLAKNLFLSGERSWLRKLLEIRLAARMEKALSKRRILELYLNVIEFGPGVFGIGPACATFFKKPPEHLTLGEMVRLAAVIPEPLRLSPLRPAPRLLRRAAIILERLRQYGYIGREEFERAERDLAAFAGILEPPPARTPAEGEPAPSADPAPPAEPSNLPSENPGDEPPDE